jgi:hypothetical protein
LYELRDASARQLDQPGECSVLRDITHLPKERPNPAAKLRDLGREAIPSLIEHFDDLRPTRCLGYGRDFWFESYYLLRYCDCCMQIFEAITGVTFPEKTTTFGTRIAEGQESECKKEALEWWSKNKDSGNPSRRSE